MPLYLAASPSSELSVGHLLAIAVLFSQVAVQPARAAICEHRTPFPCRADTVLELFEVVQSQPVTFPPDAPASDALKDLLLQMLEKVSPRMR